MTSADRVIPDSTGGSAALRLPDRGAQFDKSMCPDFILFHQTDEGVRPSIVDPHGFHLANAVGKLKGLAAYANDHGDVFARIDAVAEVDRNLMALDVKTETVRDAANQTDGGVKELFETLGGDYS